jgi:hypothetical protein
MEPLRLTLVVVNGKIKTSNGHNISECVTNTTEEGREISTLGPKFSAKPPKYDGEYLTSILRITALVCGS